MTSEVDLDVWVTGICAGDPHAFGAWMRHAEPPLRASLRRFARIVDAEAVLQEALLRTWQVAPRLESDGRPNALLRLAHRIAHNLAISEIRKQRPASPIEDDAVDEGSILPAEPDVLLRRLIVACLEALPDKPASALWSRIDSSGGRPDRDLAAELHMQLNTFLQNITRARRLLSECLERRGAASSP